MQQRKDALGGHGVQGAGGLVAKEHFRVAGQGAGDGHALLLPAAELRRIGAGLVLKTYDAKQLDHALVGLLLGHPGDLQRVANVSRHGLLHQEVELLEDHRHAAAGLAQLLLVHGQDVFAVDEDLPVGGGVQPVEAADQRALARSAHADDAVDIAFVDGQADVAQRVYLAAGYGVILAQAAYLDLRFLLHPLHTFLLADEKTHFAHLRSGLQ